MMKRKLLMAALCVVGGAFQAFAQTDVTSTYLTNADFSQGTPVTVGVCTYAKDASGNGTTYSQLVPVEGWDIPANGDARAGGLIAFGSGVWVGGPGYNAPATNSDGESTGNILGLVGVWSGTAQYTQTIKSSLPAGDYTLVLGVYNSTGGTKEFTKNLIGFIEEGGTEHFATTKVYPVNTWKYEFITFTLNAETSGKISLGYQGSNVSSSNAQHLFLSGLELYEGTVNADSYEAAKAQKRAKGEWTVAKAAAQAALENDTYAIIQGSERTDLEAEVAKAEPSTTEDYNTATEALNTATSTFTGVLANYTALETAKAAEIPSLAYASADKKTALQNAKAPSAATSADDADDKVVAIITALRAYYESHAKAEGVEGVVDYTSSITNANNPKNNDGWTWTGSKNNPASNEPWTDADGTNTHSYFDGGNWSGSSWTTTMKQTISVPAGKYLLTAKGRAATNTTLTMAVGNVSVELPHVGNSGNVFDRGWGDASLEFEVDEDTPSVDIEVTATAEPTHEWFSISDFRLVQLEKFEVPMADASDYSALATAISTAEANKLGFEEGEYAPYNNVEALKALADAKAIDPAAEGGNRQKVVQIATTTLTSATWTANDAEEVNGIYNGDFALSTPNATSGVDVDVPGWTKVDGIRMIVGNTETDPGLGNADAGKALFSWGGTTITYGETAGYTLPLKANTVYKLTCKISGWRDGDLPSWAGLAVENAEVVVPTITGVGRINQAEGDPFKTFTFKFKTSEAGDYVIGLSVNKHFTVTDLSLLKVEETEIAGTTIYAANGYGTFMSAIAREIPEGLEAYTVTGVDENKVLVMSDALESIPANTPVILENTTDADVVIPNTNGQSLAVENTYTVGLLTGTYTAIDAPNGKYLLQKQDGKVGFYQVDKDYYQPTVPANRAYLTAPDGAGAKERAFFFDGDATAIEAVSAIAAGEIEAIYTTGGVQVQSLQKGMNIVVLKNGQTQKVFVK